MGTIMPNITEIWWWGMNCTSLGECQTGIIIRSPVAGELFATNFLSKFPFSTRLQSVASLYPLVPASTSVSTAKTCHLPPRGTHPGAQYIDSFMMTQFTRTAAAPWQEHRRVHVPSITVKQLSCVCKWHFERDDGHWWQISLVVSDKYVLVPVGNLFLRLKSNILQVPYICPKKARVVSGLMEVWGTQPSVLLPSSQTIASLSSTT